MPNTRKRIATATRRRRRKPAPAPSYDVVGQRRRTITYLESQEERGLKQCKVWVPDGTQEALREFAAQLRGE